MFWIPDFDSEQLLVSARREWPTHEHFWTTCPREPVDSGLEHLLQQNHVKPAVELASNLDLDPDLAEPTGGMEGSTGLT